VSDDDGDVTRRELEELVLGGPRLYTRAEVAARSDVPVELADRMWRALGFADVADDDRSFTDNDVQALREAVALVEAGVVDQVTLLAMTRAMGQTLSRLAEWQVESVAELILRQGIEVSERDLFETARFLLPVLERLTRHVWRRHLVAVPVADVARRDERDPLVGAQLVHHPHQPTEPVRHAQQVRVQRERHHPRARIRLGLGQQQRRGVAHPALVLRHRLALHRDHDAVVEF